MVQIIMDREKFNDVAAMFIVHTLKVDSSQNKILEDKAHVGTKTKS